MPPRLGGAIDRPLDQHGERPWCVSGILGVADPKAAFNELRPYRQRLIDLQDRCRPFKTEFLILHAAQVALDAAAHFFTGEPDFYALRPDQSRATSATLARGEGRPEGRR